MIVKSLLSSLSLSITGSLLLVGCQKPVAKVESPIVAEVAPVQAVVSAKVATVEEPKPETAEEKPASAAPVPAAPELAPVGVFYLVRAARIETDSGITGLPPGTGVKLLHDDVYLTPAGEAQLAAEQLTNNLAVARAARDADRVTQGAAQARIAREGVMADARAKAEAEIAPESPAAVAAPSAAPTLSSGYSNPLNRPTDPLNTTHSSTEDKVYKDAAGRLYWKDVFGKAHYFQ